MKALTSSLKHFVVQKLRISNKEAVQLIVSGKVLVNNQQGTLTQVVLPEDIILFNSQVIKEAEAFIYLAYYKPRGIESTLNPAIPDNLFTALQLPQRVFPVGRLDKESEGLMLLTNNGKIFDQIIHSENHQEKEYKVTVDKPLSPEALNLLANGIIIMGRKTRPAIVNQLDSFSFTIVLTQGLNRQIRRMCYKVGYQVNQLIRIRIINICLGNLAPGEWRNLSKAEVQALIQMISPA
ncbi:pseudouridine synthase [Adhaeribacter aquaticus]|uniref:pseudouridine synthase n=1 Tax=Adhaeribacter aquaticus TaxID=299567 RepID=UPI0003F9081D|nr:pseudouridine synthase [Adhaeribacter aquaticus]